MIWAVTLVVIALLFIFPKQTGILLFVLLVGIGIVALIDYLVSGQKGKEQESVSVVVLYAPDSCGQDSPLSFKITNESKKIVNKVSWNVIATERGYSNNIVDYESFPSYQGEYSISYHSENSTPYSTNKILKPGELFSACYKAPLIKGKLSPQNLIWKVSNKYSEFQ
jgi:diacylglycerol kinase family enzyme